jgi:leader peptidase (prepilin peptidase)/N-methyltransferase
MPPLVHFFDPASLRVVSSAEGRWLIVGLSAALGAAIGSFLNVVAYRMPRGMSLVTPGSRCPVCGHAIRWYDNVPVAGWLLLGGRCRDCRAPIAARYPLVEALVALAGAALGWAAFEDVSGGMARAYGFDFTAFVVRLALFGTLFAAALIEFDGHRVPLRLLGWVLVAGFAIGSIWPGVRYPLDAAGDMWRGVREGAAGLGAALLLAALAWPGWVASSRRGEVRAGLAAALELAVVGVLLGAADAAVVAAGADACYLGLRVLSRFWRFAGRFGWAASLCTITLTRMLVLPADLSAWQPLQLYDVLWIVIFAGMLIAMLSLVALLGLVRPQSVDS